MENSTIQGVRCNSGITVEWKTVDMSVQWKQLKTCGHVSGMETVELKTCHKQWNGKTALSRVSDGPLPPSVKMSGKGTKEISESEKMKKKKKWGKSGLDMMNDLVRR
ncbi:hypothetical protein CEXT_381441, partial [Caerostris extrusa]